MPGRIVQVKKDDKKKVSMENLLSCVRDQHVRKVFVVVGE
eukprot:gene4988-3583_t